MMLTAWQVSFNYVCINDAVIINSFKPLKVLDYKAQIMTHEESNCSKG